MSTSEPTGFKFQPTSEDELLICIKSIGNPSAECDGLTAHTMKVIANEIVTSLRDILNRIILTFVYSNSLKRARVVAIPKVKSPFSTGDFRPTSVLPVLNKIVGRVLASQLTNFFESNKLLHEKQFGFRRKRSTIHAVTQTMKGIRNGLDNGQVCGMLLIDSSKAFDSVRAEVLLVKMEAYGVKSEAIRLMKSYLTDRQQCVQVDNSCSPFLPVRLGVPQGSGFGPLFFLTMINNLSKVCTGEVSIFAIHRQNSNAKCKEI